MVAARNTPLQPNSPDTPVFSGMNGCQLAGSTCAAPMPTNRQITNTLMATMIALTNADWVTPTYSRPVTAATISTAGRLNSLPEAANSCPFQAIGAALSASGNGMCSVVVMKLIRYADQPTATEAEANRYSSTRHQPMNQAMPSPRVA
ncbi:hypothetical protein D3C72_999410 [compost metagenome]